MASPLDRLLTVVHLETRPGPLCFVDQYALTSKRTRELLRAGALVEASESGQTPLQLAQVAEGMGGATEGTTAHLILESMKFWSPKTHQLHPAPA